jgi:hypothetical protein
MMMETSGRPARRRSTRWPNALASAIIPTTARTIESTRPSARMCSPAATSSEPNITHSPTAKFIMRDDL